MAEKQGVRFRNEMEVGPGGKQIRWKIRTVIRSVCSSLQRNHGHESRPAFGVPAVLLRCRDCRSASAADYPSRRSSPAGRAALRTFSRARFPVYLTETLKQPVVVTTARALRA